MGIGWTSSLSVNIEVVLPFMFIPLWPWFGYVSFRPLDSGWSIESIGYCWKVDRPRECQTWNHQAASNFKTTLMYTLKWNDWNYIKSFLHTNVRLCMHLTFICILYYTLFMYELFMYWVYIYIYIHVVFILVPCSGWRCPIMMLDNVRIGTDRSLQDPRSKHPVACRMLQECHMHRFEEWNHRSER